MEGRRRGGRMKILQVKGRAFVKTDRTMNEPLRELQTAQSGWNTRAEQRVRSTGLEATTGTRLPIHGGMGTKHGPNRLWDFWRLSLQWPSGRETVRGEGK